MKNLESFAIVRLGGPSNTRYVGVNSQSSAKEGREFVRITADILQAKKLGTRSVLLVGGEPFLRKDLPNLFKAILDHRLLPTVATNGRMLVYGKIRQLIVRAKVPYLRVELHGPTPKVHDSIVGVQGAFDQTFEGLRNLLLDGPSFLRVDVACTVLSHNLPYLDEWVDTLTTLPRRARLSLRLVAPLAVAAREDWPVAQEVSVRVGKAVERIRRAGTDVVATWEGFPTCLLEDHESARDDRLRCSCPVLGPTSAGSAIPLEGDAGRQRPFPCQECDLEPRCRGASKAFLLHDGESSLNPRRSVRANSFNFEYVRQIRPFQLDPDDCTARSLALPRGPARSLLLVDSNTASLYESPTSDFSDEQISHVKDDLEQVYLDIDDHATLDDFAMGLRRVRFDPRCPSCPFRPTCCGAVHVASEPPFGPEERWLAEDVSKLEGRVLDVGCGDLIYRDALAPAIAAGKVEYHGLDPDESALARLRRTGMRATLHHGDIETFTHDANYFDAVLVLRSVNHFRDMNLAFQTLSRILRIGGTILLCDSPPFAMLRTPTQIDYADVHAPVGHEHYRNWTSQQLVDFMQRFPFHVDVNRPVTSNTSAEWIVKATRVIE